MELDWSEQSPHIRSLYLPWQLGDGYEEAEIEAAEARLGLRLPATLRNFYLVWGKRPDLTQTHHLLLNPSELLIRAETLIFCVESQHVGYWGVSCEALEEDDPPVIVIPSGQSRWEAAPELIWTERHPHLSSFPDDLTYHLAFCGGAIHGGWTKHSIPDLSAHHIAWLEENWNKARVTPLVFGLDPDPTIENWVALYGPTLYVRDSQAFYACAGCSMAAREAEVLDEIGKRFQLTWAKRW